MKEEDRVKYLKALAAGEKVTISQLDAIPWNLKSTVIERLPIGRIELIAEKFGDVPEGMLIVYGEQRMTIVMPYEALTCETIRVVEALTGLQETKRTQTVYFAGGMVAKKAVQVIDIADILKNVT